MNWTSSTHAGVLLLEFERPPRNMMSFAAMEELLGILTPSAEDPSVRVVVIASRTPGYFVGHGDLEDLIAIGRDQRPSGRADGWGRVFSLIEAMPQPVIAAVDGQAWGGGCELASACTIRLASTRAHFAQPEVDLGIIPGAGGTLRLARLIGLGRAMEMILSGRIIDAAEAMHIGLVNVVLPVPGFEAATIEFAQRLAAKRPAAVAAAKAAVLFGATHTRREALRHEADRFMELQRTPETLVREREVLDLYARTSADELIDLARL